MTVITEKMPDFSGYATKNGLECSDGRTIVPDAFKHNDQKRVPLVWRHIHDDPNMVLGHAILENRKDGVYARAFLNDTEQGMNARKLVQHGDVEALSIYANKLKQQGRNVIHGDIKEVSLVLSGANPGAFIDDINLQHSDSEDALIGEVIIYTNETITLEHADNQGDTMANTNNAVDGSVQDVYDTLNPEQKNLVDAMLYSALNGNSSNGNVQHSDEDSSDDSDENEDEDSNEPDSSDEDSNEDSDSSDNDSDESISDNSSDSDDSDDESASDNTDAPIQHSNQEGLNMSRNVFEQTESAKKPHLSHAEIVSIVNDAKKIGSYREAMDNFLEHADYGIEDIEFFFPDAKSVGDMPQILSRQTEWVPKVLDATKHSPFAKIKSIGADLTAEEARARGYIKGHEKKDEVVKLMKRTTGPTTVYKKQKLDRDDIIDITDFDVVAWLKWEIRFMLNEEIARAILIGDGRSSGSDDKIKDPEGATDGVGIRSILHDNDLYAHPVLLAANVSAEAMIDGITRARTNYRGSGSPTFYTTDAVLTDLLLLKDKMGRRLYATEGELASALRVKEIVPVEVMVGQEDLIGIVVNLSDYTVGANKGGELSFFEDFDIDFNQQKYLMELRISGALTKFKSALIIKRQQGTSATPAAPSFDGPTNKITVPTTTGINYLIDDVIVTGQVTITKNTEVVAEAKPTFYIPFNTTKNWPFTYTA